MKTLSPILRRFGAVVPVVALLALAAPSSVAEAAPVKVAASTGDPIGALDAVTPRPDGALQVRGWATDQNTSAPIQVAVYLDGIGLAWFTANTGRPDVGAAYPGSGSLHGYDFAIPLSNRGVFNVCTYAINSGPGANTLLGCRTVEVNGLPFGALDAVSSLPGALQVRGWAIDQNTSAPIQVAVYLDGIGLGWFTANAGRPDVGAVYSAYGASHGYDVEVPATPGAHLLCTYAINANPSPGFNVLLGCGVATV
jgi:hypothetical protein